MFPTLSLLPIPEVRSVRRTYLAHIYCAEPLAPLRPSSLNPDARQDFRMILFLLSPPHFAAMTLNYRVVPPEENQENLQGWPQVEVYEGSVSDSRIVQKTNLTRIHSLLCMQYQSDRLAPMMKFATNELLNMLYGRVRDMIGEMPKDGYSCEPQDLDYQGQEPASWPS